MQRLCVLGLAWGLAGMPATMAQAPPFTPLAATRSAPVKQRQLAQFYRSPQAPGENNHYIDMWAGQNLRDLALAAGLTNNHALLVNSHGKAIRTVSGRQYVYYPHPSLVKAGQTNLFFSSADLAAVLGSAAAQIHNIIIAGCNVESAFSSSELRKFFVNATNIIHAPAGQMGYQPMFLQALLTHSYDIQPLYEIPHTNHCGTVEYHIEYVPAQASTRLSPYVAELFEQRAMKPFRIQIAGRELLVPSSLFSAGRRVRS